MEEKLSLLSYQDKTCPFEEDGSFTTDFEDWCLNNYNIISYGNSNGYYIVVNTSVCLELNPDNLTFSTIKDCKFDLSSIRLSVYENSNDYENIEEF